MTWLYAKRGPAKVRDGKGGPMRSLGREPVWFDRFVPYEFDEDVGACKVQPPAPSAKPVAIPEPPRPSARPEPKDASAVADPPKRTKRRTRKRS